MKESIYGSMFISTTRVKFIARERGNIQIVSCEMGNCVEKVKNHWFRATGVDTRI